MGLPSSTSKPVPFLTLHPVLAVALPHDGETGSNVVGGGRSVVGVGDGRSVVGVGDGRSVVGAGESEYGEKKDGRGDNGIVHSTGCALGRAGQSAGGLADNWQIPSLINDSNVEVLV